MNTFMNHYVSALGRVEAQVFWIKNNSKRFFQIKNKRKITPKESKSDSLSEIM